MAQRSCKAFDSHDGEIDHNSDSLHFSDSFMWPRESAQFIVDSTVGSHPPYDISLGTDLALDDVAKMVLQERHDQSFQLNHSFSSCPVHPGIATDPRAVIDWIFFVDCVNFSFWSDGLKEKSIDEMDKSVTVTKKDKPSRQQISHNQDQPYLPRSFSITLNNSSGQASIHCADSEHSQNTAHTDKYTGYYALCGCVNRALAQDIPLTSAEFMARVLLEQLTPIFTGDEGVIIPMLDERVRVINECGNVLLEKFNGSFVDCIRLANGSARQLLKIIIENFPSFRDMAKFRGRTVSFLKRAQILIYDLYEFFAGVKTDNQPPGERQNNEHKEEFRSFCSFEDIDSLTMFADYRVPQALVYLRALHYSPALIEHLQNFNCFVESGSELEIFIRGFSIFACDKIVERINNQGNKIANDKQQNVVTTRPQNHRLITAAELDVFLWMYRRANSEAIELAGVPFHRCRTIFY